MQQCHHKSVHAAFPHFLRIFASCTENLVNPALSSETLLSHVVGYATSKKTSLVRHTQQQRVLCILHSAADIDTTHSGCHDALPTSAARSDAAEQSYKHDIIDALCIAGHLNADIFRPAFDKFRFLAKVRSLDLLI